MKLDKAIEILTDQALTDEEETEPDFLDAIKLGREALKHIKRGRLCRGNFVDNKLPGEDS